MLNTRKRQLKSKSAISAPRKDTQKLNGPLGTQKESELMLKEERMQRKTDRFWGQEKEARDKMLERMMMEVEDKLSLSYEEALKKVALQFQWDLELEQRNQNYKFLKQNQNDVNTMNYLKYLNENSSSLQNIANYSWTNQSNSQPNNKKLDSQAESIHPFNSLLLGNSFSLAIDPKVGTKTISNKTNKNLQNVAADPGFSLSMHVDGLQQSRLIVSEAAFFFKQTLRQLNSTNAVPLESKATTNYSNMVKSKPMTPLTTMEARHSFENSANVITHKTPLRSIKSPVPRYRSIFF
jgi:hypothetical protein